jgi:hypothetical protein
LFGFASGQSDVGVDRFAAGLNTFSNALPSLATNPPDVDLNVCRYDSANG